MPITRKVPLGPSGIPGIQSGSPGIDLDGNGNSIVEGNYLGTDVTGKLARPNFAGIDVSESSNNVVGGTTAAARNIISGNYEYGVVIAGSSSNRVTGNFIGTDVTGTLPLGNHSLGAGVGSLDPNGDPQRRVYSNNNTIENNTISATQKRDTGGYPIPSAGDGIGIGASGTLVQNNFIGTSADGKTAIPNARHGISGGGENTLPTAANRIVSNTIAFNLGTGVAVGFDENSDFASQGGVTQFRIESNAILSNRGHGIATGGLGNVLSVVSNTIASSGAAGVLITGKDQCEISQNAIYSNGGLGIDLSKTLAPDGVTPNDSLDPDTGPNNLQNFPVLTLAESNTRLKGTLNSTAGSSFRVEFFQNDACAPSGYGQGKKYLSSIQLSTDAQGNASFDAPFSLTAGQTYTATATLLVPGKTGLTSEFSACAAPPGGFQLVALSGKKFEDLNGNGVRDSGDPGLAGWTIRLSGPVTRTAVTDSAGNYLFDKVDSGSYQITEVLQSNWVQTFPGSPYSVTTKSGVNVSGLDFGNFRNMLVQGKKWDDRNGNGAIDAGEPGLAGWTIQLDLHSDGSIDQTATTDASGNYSFTVGPGDPQKARTFTVSEVQQSGWIPTTPAPAPIAIQSGKQVALNFGNRKPGGPITDTGTIRGVKFNDQNGNGRQDTNEAGLSGWWIVLNGDLDKRMTNAQGGFEFSNLQPGTYTVSEKLMPGWVAITEITQTVSLQKGETKGVVFGNQQQETSCSCTPETKTNKIGTEHTVTVKVMRKGWFGIGAAPVAGAPVGMRITEGPNLGKQMSGTTDGNGEVKFTYKSERGGTDYLWASGSSGETVFSCSATKTWSDAIVLTPRLVLSCFCKDKPVPVKVTEGSENGKDITADSGVSFEWIRPGGLAADVAKSVLAELGIDGDIASLEVQKTATGAAVVFKSAGVNILEARRKLSDGTYVKSNLAFLMSGIKLMEAEGLKIEPLTLTSPLVNRITDAINDGLKRESELHAPMILFPPTPQGQSTCWAPLNYVANKGYVRVKEIKFKFLNGYIKDVDLMKALEDVIGLAQEIVPFAWWMKAIAMGTPLAVSQFLDFKVSKEKYVRGAGEVGTEDKFIKVANEYNLLEGELLKGVVFAKGSGISAVQATLDLEEYCLGKATDLMTVVVLPDLEKVDIRNENGHPQEPLVVNVGSTIQPHGVGVFSFLSSPFQVTFDPLGETNRETLRQIADSLLPGSGKKLDDFGLPVPPITLPWNTEMRNGVYEGGDYYLRMTVSWQPIAAILNFEELRVQIPLWKYFTEWSLKPTPNPYATVLDNRGAVIRGDQPGRTTLRMDVCIPLLTRRADENGLRVAGSTIRGNKFFDKNRNGKKDADEPGLPGWRIELNGGESLRITDKNGDYAFEDLAPARYSVTEVPKPGWVATTPSSVTVQLERDRIVFVDFGNRLEACEILGFKFNDFDRDGVLDTGEPLLPGWQIELDNPPGSQITAGDGWYSFGNLQPGKYTVREVQQSGWYSTTGISQTVTLEAGQLAFVHFGNTQLPADRGVVSGTKFEDLNGDGKWDPGEPGLPGWTVTLTGPSSRTAVTDSNGAYRFADLLPGSYTVSEVLTAGWTRTTAIPAAVSLAAGKQVEVNFGNFRNMKIGGRKFDDRNLNGQQDADEPGLPGWTIQLDLHNDGTADYTAVTDAEGDYRFINVGPGNPASLRFFTIREVQQSGWRQTSPKETELHPITSGLLIANADFGNVGTVKILGIKFEDLNGNGQREVGESGLPSWTIFVDLNRDGILNGPKGNGVCVPDVSEPCAVTNALGAYVIGGLIPGVYRVREVAQSGWKQTTKDPDDLPLKQSGQAMINIDFGGMKQGGASGAEIRGKIIYDVDRDGVKDAREPGLQGWTAFIDTNNNGQLDAGEKSAVADATGNYALTGLTAGTWTVRIVQRTGWRQTLPAAGGAYSRALVANQKIADLDFGVYILNPVYFYFPYYQGDAYNWTGFSISSRSSQPVSGLLTAYGADGTPLNFPTNPSAFRLDPYCQSARLGQEIFGLTAPARQSGWVEMIADSAELGTMYQFAGNTLMKMDGGVPFTKTGKKLYFTRIYQDQWLTTYLSIANPGDQRITLKLQLFKMLDTAGHSAPPVEVTRSIPAKGLLFDSVGEIFNSSSDFAAYVVAEVSDGPGAVGYEVVQQDYPEMLLGLDAQFGTSFVQAFSAQLANGPDVGTLFKFVNIGGGTRKVTMTAYDEQGKTIASSSFSLSPSQQYEDEAGNIFNLGFTTLTVGSVRVTTDGDGIIGDVVFGEPYEFTYTAGLPLQTSGFTEAVFSHLVNGAGYWTGLALYNPNAQPADVTIQVFSPSGVQTGQGRLTMPAGTRLSKLLWELVPTSQGQLGGYLVIRSSQSLIAQEVFGDSGQNMLSAVPPVVVK